MMLSPLQLPALSPRIVACFLWLLVTTHGVQSFQTTNNAPFITRRNFTIAPVQLYRGGSNPYHPYQRTASARSTPAALVTRTTVSSSITPSSDDKKVVLFTPDRLNRSLVAAVACCWTWCVANYTPLTIIQASSSTGLLACLLTLNRNVPYTVAAFCGSLAGMSGNLLASSTGGTIAPAQLVPIVGLSTCLVGTFAIWDEAKWGVGKGGRLGTIAFAANFFYFFAITLVRYIIGKPAPFPATLIPSSIQALYTTLPIMTSLVLSTAFLQWSRQRTTIANSSSTTLLPQQQQQPSAALIHGIAKVLLIGSLNLPLFLSGKVQWMEYAGTILSIMMGNQIVHQAAPSFGPVLPTALVGCVGALLFPGGGTGYFHITPPKLYLGALMGLTTIPNFAVAKFLQSSVLSASLFHMGLLDGFGGKLGCLAYLGILFGM